ncbi:hypothetical protein [Aquibacillus kalidii]|uniref:hypothetical protein n=1 Tax=Aquibacillus kalidii TaxID=2762597 RepID=UPI001C99817C|nr:hypothetical protein [Aquibacillus kalidii]
MKKKKEKNTWILLLSNVGFAYMFEYIALNLFQAYSYKPSVLKDKYIDKIFGAILSQALFVPITCTFLTVCQKNYRWKIGFSLYYYLIEKLFLRLNIYTVNWWKPFYTLFLINFYFYLSEWFYKFLEQRKAWALKCAHFLSIVVINITLLYVMAIRHKIRFGKGTIHSWKEHFIIAPLYSLGLSFIAVVTSSRSRFISRFSYLFFCIFIDVIFLQKGIMKIKHYYENILFHIAMLSTSRIIYNYINKGN